jgi:arylsulfatase
MQAAIRFLQLFWVIILLSCSVSQKKDIRPNILLIVADDLGYSDLGCFGGEIRTPNIDYLADHGLRFSRFHAGPTCAVTRAMMLSGNNNHVAGMGNQDILLTESPMIGKPGYEGHLSQRIIPMPLLLQKSGYHTYLSGKWHLGIEESDSPAHNGFEKSFCLLQGGSNHFNNIGIEPDDTLAQFRENGRLIEYPEGQYSSELYTKKLIEFIKSENQGEAQQPFFAFASYTSPHFPLQVPNDYLNRYEGDYDMGYDSLRALRFRALKEAGMITQDAVLPPRLVYITPWDSLSAEKKKSESRKMELYAAMVDNLDYHVGQLIQSLKLEDLFDNTIIIFMSDNGAAGNDLYNEAWSRDFIRSHYDNSYENMGKVNSFVSYGPQWAQAGAAPFNRYKGYTTEGGTNAPFIISGKNIPANGEISDTYFTVMDLAPTFYELAGVTYPGTLGTAKTKPLLGNSILPYLQGNVATIHDQNYGVGLEHRGRICYRKGDWKIVNLEAPYDEAKMMLFNIATDLGETTDLRNTHPEKFEELLNEWKRFIMENEIIIAK